MEIQNLDTLYLLDSLKQDSMEQVSLNGPDTVEYSAVDLFYNYRKKTFSLSNKAQLKYQGATLNADTIEFDQESTVLQATGIPIIKDRNNPPIMGYRLKYSMKKKLGQFYYASTTDKGQHFNGMDVRRLEDGRLQIARGDFCACDDDNPSYYFYSRRMVVKPEESITARPVVLNIADVPIAVLPIMIAPLEKGRHSGILTPKFGGDQSQGFYIQNVGYYWAISDYMDFIFKGNLVEGSEAKFDDTRLNSQYRYKKRYIVDGYLDFEAYLEEFSLDNYGYDINFRHNQNLTPDGRTKLSGQGSFVSDRNLRKDKALDEETILNQTANAYITFSKSFKDNKSLSIDARQEYNLQTGYLNRSLPKISYSMSGPLISERHRSENDTSSTPHWYEKVNYSYNWNSDLKYIQAYDSILEQDTSRYWPGFKHNLDFDYNGTLFNVINVTPSMNFEGNWSAYSYNQPYDSLDNSFNFDNNISKGKFGDNFFKHSYSLNTDTKLYGIVRPNIGRFTGLRHVITPNVGYTWAPEIDTNYSFVPIPGVHSSPFQSEQRTVNLGLDNALDIKYRLLSDKLSKTDSLEEEKYKTRTFIKLNSYTSYNFAADSLNWSNIRSNLSLSPVESYTFSLNFTHSFYHEFSEQPIIAQFPELTAYSFGLGKSFSWSGKFNAGLPSKNGKYSTTPWSASFRYNMSYASQRVSQNLFDKTITHSSSASASIQPSENWQMSYNTVYDFNEGNFAQHKFNFSRKLDCWHMQFTWTPIGATQGWSFLIYITDLPDFKLQTGNTSVSRN